MLNLALYRRALAALLALALLAGVSAAADPGKARAAAALVVYVGNGKAGIAVEQFLPADVTIPVGTAIQFTNPYEEIHTVTFLAGAAQPPFVIPAPGAPATAGPPKLIVNPLAANPTAAATFDGSAYANSGILFKGQSWTQTFTKAGTYNFLCILHPGMTARINVTETPFGATTQAQADQIAAQTLAAALAAGEASSANARTRGLEIVVPDSVGTVDVMRFAPVKLQVAVGDTVTWRNPTAVPHTVTFTSGAAAPPFVTPEFGAAGPPTLVLNPQVLFPVSSGAYDGTGYVNSGFLGTGPEATAGATFSLKFTKAGTYTYVCVLHADQGMAGVIEVVGGAAAIGGPSTGDAGLAAAEGGPAPPWAALAGAAAVGLAALALAARRVVGPRRP